MQDAVQIRWMIRRDMPDVLAIESACYPHPWAEEDFLVCLRQRNCIGMVAERDEVILGFMLYELQKKHLHVLNFAVAPEFQRQGVGTAMVEKLKHKLSQQRRTAVTLECRDDNLAACLFWKRHGFRGRLVRDYYIQEYGGGDCIQFRYDIARQPEWVPTNRISGLFEGAGT